MKLVRIPSKSTDPSMTDDALVVVTRDVADKDVLHVEFTALSDRRNLLFNVVRASCCWPTFNRERVELVGAHGKGKRPCLQTAHMTI